MTYSMIMVLYKISTALFLLRLIPYTNHLRRRIIYVAVGFACVVGLTLFFLVMLQCHPLSNFWNKELPGSCLPIDAILTALYVYSAFAIATDLTFTLLPIHLIWQVQMDKRTKLVLIPIMCLAFVASFAVIIRLQYIPSFKATDFLYATTGFGIWAALEQGLAITAASLATLRPLMRQVLSQFRTLTDSNNH
ncbi:hypothetical protein GGR56DRAFT_179873 [Xylariaceae sp. FL0804]|nr:hypothetical protein GGR56DRAFT_179873 [Xylariaceae sp. FL0804]